MKTKKKFRLLAILSGGVGCMAAFLVWACLYACPWHPKWVPANLACTIGASKDRFAQGEPAVVTFTLTNHSNMGVWVMGWSTPFEREGKEFYNNIFEVHLRGKEAPYAGAYAGCRELWPTRASSYWLEPGQSKTISFDLRAGYDLSEPGEYTIRYSREVHYSPRGRLRRPRRPCHVFYVEVTSNTIHVTVIPKDQRTGIGGTSY